MATLTTEQCPTGTASRNGNIDSKSSLEDTSLISNGVPSFASLYGFIKDFRKPIKTLSFWSSDRRAVRPIQQIPAPATTSAEHERPIEYGPHSGEFSIPPIEGQIDQSVSEPEEPAVQANVEVQDDDHPPRGDVPQETSPERELNERPTFSRKNLEETHSVEESHMASLSEALLPERAVLSSVNKGTPLYMPEIPACAGSTPPSKSASVFPSRSASVLPTVKSTSSLPAKGQLQSQAPAVLATDLKGKGKSVAAEASGFLSQNGFKPFAERGKSLFEATRLRPDKALIAQWKSSGRQVVDKRLRDLHLGQNIISNLRLCMLGSTPDEYSMKPTILIVCSDEKKIKEIDNCLREFIRISFPDCVEFKIVAGNLRLASGPGGSATSDDEEKSPLELEVAMVSENRSTVVGRGIGFPIEKSSAFDDLDYPTSLRATMGGIITVGNSMYGLTVAHSLFGNARRPNLLGIGKLCGWIESYEWSVCGHLSYGSTQTGHTDLPEPVEAVAMDWLLIRLRQEFMLPNQYYFTSDDESPHDISGFVPSVDLPDHNVWVCSGATQPQLGILDSTPSSIIIDQVSYEVLSIALENPLAPGDSGSWVVSDNKLCGYIFAIIDGEPWAYMLPIEPVFSAISKHLSKESKLEVDVLDADMIQSLKRAISARETINERDEFQLRAEPSTVLTQASENEHKTCRLADSTLAPSKIPCEDQSSIPGLLLMPSTVPHSPLISQNDSLTTYLNDVSQVILDRWTLRLRASTLPVHSLRSHFRSRSPLVIPFSSGERTPLLATIPSSRDVELALGTPDPPKISNTFNLLFQEGRLRILRACHWSYQNIQTTYYEFLPGFHASLRKYGTVVTIFLYSFKLGAPLCCIAIMCSVPFWTDSVAPMVFWMLVAALLLVPIHYIQRYMFQWLEHKQKRILTPEIIRGTTEDPDDQLRDDLIRWMAIEEDPEPDDSLSEQSDQE